LSNDTKKKKPNLVSPRGVARYPKLTTPDTKFKKEGEFSVKLLLSEEAAKPLIEQIDAAMEESYQKAVQENKGKKIKRADPPYKQDDEDENLVQFHFKMKASGETNEGWKWTQRPVIVDAKGNVIEDAQSLRIGGGSSIKVSFFLKPWWTQLLGAGVNLALKGVQIFDLKEWKQDLGFKAEEGYTYSASEDEGNDFTSSGNDGSEGEGSADPGDGDF
jgi:hypothetical protein